MPTRRPDPAPLWPHVLFALALLFVAFYLLRFFTQEWQPGFTRFDLLLTLLRPEDFFAEWCAGDRRLFGLLDRLPAVAWASAILFAAYGLGSLCRRLVPLTIRDSLTSAAMTLAIGLGLLSMLTLLIGLCGGLRMAWLFRCGIAWLMAVGGWQWVKNVVGTLNVPTTWADREAIAWGVLAAVFTALLLWSSLTPATDFDALEYHLQAPKEWHQAGQIGYLPHNRYASMPLGAEMFSLLAMTLIGGNDAWWLGGLVGQVVMATFVPLTAVVIAGESRRWFSSAVGWAAAALYVGLPAVVLTTRQGLNEPVLCAYSLLAFVLCCRTNHVAGTLRVPSESSRGANGTRSVPTTCWAGFFAGQAVACKYTSVVFVLLPLFVWLIVRLLCRPPSRRDVRPLVWFVLAASIAAGPWLAKNVVQTGNPVYPLLATTFGPTSEGIARFAAVHAVPRDAAGWRYSFAAGADAVQRFLLTSTTQSPCLVPLVAFAALGCWTARGTRRQRMFIALALGLAGWILASWWLVTHRLDRFWMPGLPLLALVAAGSLAHAPAWGKINVRAFIGLGLMYQLAYALSPLPGDPRWFTRLDLLRTGAALSPTDVPRVPAHIRYLNQVAQPGEGVLLVGDAAVYPLRPRAWYHTCFDASLLVDWTLDSSAEARRAHFVRRRIVWVVVNPAELERYRQPGNYGYDPRFRETILDELIAAGILTPVEWQVALPSAEPSRTKIYRVEGGSHD